MASMIRGASLLISLQLISRLVTFAANQLLLRYLTAPLLGISTQLEVYYLSVLFFARESLRVAIQRQPIDTSLVSSSKDASKGEAGKKTDQEIADAVVRDYSQAVINLGYLAIVLGLVVNVLFGKLYLRATPSATLSDTPYLSTSLYLYGIAAMVELLSEPCFVLMQVRLQFGTRAVAESAATFLRCAVVFATAVWGGRVVGSEGQDMGVLPFALGQLTYGTVLLLVYITSSYRLATASNFSLLPRPLSSSEFIWSYFYRPSVNLATSMMAQSVVKHILTQGDTFLVSILSTAETQGVYALANNYGGLLARLLFQPVEESSRSYFSRLLSSANVAPPSKDSSQALKDSAAKQKKAAISEAKQSLSTLLRLYLILSSIILALGPSASPSLLAIVAGSRWTTSGAGTALSAYCLYIPLLALNGLTESFVASVASTAEVRRQSLWMGLFSAIFAGAAWVFLGALDMGARGLVAANAVNMGCRIVWSCVFVKGYFKQHGDAFVVSDAAPWSTLVAGVSTWVMLEKMDVMQVGGEKALMTLVKIAGSAIPLLLLIVFLERRFLLDCLSSIRGRRISIKS